MLRNELERRDAGGTVVMGGEVFQMGPSMTYPHIDKNLIYKFERTERIMTTYSCLPAYVEVIG